MKLALKCINFHILHYSKGLLRSYKHCARISMEMNFYYSIIFSCNHNVWKASCRYRISDDVFVKMNHVDFQLGQHYYKRGLSFSLCSPKGLKSTVLDITSIWYVFHREDRWTKTSWNEEHPRLEQFYLTLCNLNRKPSSTVGFSGDKSLESGTTEESRS